MRFWVGTDCRWFATGRFECGGYETIWYVVVFGFSFNLAHKP